MRTSDVTDGQPVASRSFLVLVVSLLTQLTAGTMYWYPAIVPGIEKSLSLTPFQSSILVTFATSGPLLGLVGGFFHDRYGSRVTATVGALAMTICFITLSTITAKPPLFLGIFIFPLLAAVTLVMVTCSFMIYSSSVSTAASVFPPEYRGRIVGLSVACYGASAAVLAAFQAAFLSDVEQTPIMLFVVSIFCACGAMGAVSIYPSASKFDPDSIVLYDDYNAISDGSVIDNASSHIESRLTFTYRVAFAWFLSLQFAAVADIWQLARWYKLMAEALITCCLLSLWWLPLNSRMRISPLMTDPQVTDDDTVEDEDVSEDEPPNANAPEPSFKQVLTDARYVYMLFAGISFVGGGGVAILVQLPYLFRALQFGGSNVWADIEVSVLVRAFVTLFSACNMGARLLAGFISDRGETSVQRQMWKYTLLTAQTLTMGVALSALAVPSRWAVLAGVAVGGFSWGMWFAAAPALVTLWFGTRNFPRNFSLLGAFECVGSFVLSDSMPDWLRKHFGTWVDGQVDDVSQKVCGGAWCSAPSFVILSLLSCSLFVIGAFLRDLVRRRAQCISY